MITDLFSFSLGSLTFSFVSFRVNTILSKCFGIKIAKIVQTLSVRVLQDIILEPS